MTHELKTELLSLLNELKDLLPAKEKRGMHTNHYANLEKRIDSSVKGLKDKDYLYIQQASDKFLNLQLQGKITHEEYMQFARIDPEE